MDPVTGAAIIAGGASLAGGLLQNSSNKRLVRETNAANAAEAARNRQFNAVEAKQARDWEEYMSNTSYQRGIKDMKLAGINPLLGIAQGGASTPGGAQASGTPASFDAARMENVVSPAANSAMSALNLAADLKLKNEQANLTKASAQKTEKETGVVTEKLDPLDRVLNKMIDGLLNNARDPVKKEREKQMDQFRKKIQQQNPTLKVS